MSVTLIVCAVLNYEITIAGKPVYVERESIGNYGIGLNPKKLEIPEETLEVNGRTTWVESQKEGRVPALHSYDQSNGVYDVSFMYFTANGEIVSVSINRNCQEF